MLNCTRDLATRLPSSSVASVSDSASSATAAVAMSRVKSPEKTLSRRKTICSRAESSWWLHSKVAFSVWCRAAAVRRPGHISANWLSSCLATSRTPKASTRLAASSMASAKPSSFRQISLTSGASSSASAKPFRVEATRSTNSCTAANPSASTAVWPSLTAG